MAHLPRQGIDLATLGLEKISPCQTLRSDRDKFGSGSSPHSLPRAGIRRPGRGCQLPDAILHGKRSFRPHSRAVQGLAATEVLSEASWLASADVCATGRRTG